MALDVSGRGGTSVDDVDAGPFPQADGAISPPTRDGGLSVCVSTDQQITTGVSKGPVDVVWVVDSSGSMVEEAALVQQQMNAFAQRFADGGIDARIVLMASAGFVEVPPPLGSDASRFLRIERRIGSTTGLSALLQRWDQFGDWLRPDADLHIVLVTDDDSALRYDCFVEGMKRVLPPNKSFQYHSISSEFVPTPGQPASLDNVPSAATCDELFDLATYDKFPYEHAKNVCGAAYHAGLQHRKLVEATGGTAHSICSQDWNAVFDQLGGRIEQVAVEGCVLDLPPAPAGAQLDPDKVRVTTNQDGAKRALQRVHSASDCEADAWHYDNEQTPTQVLLCDDTCSALSVQGAQVSLELGCAWVVR